MRVLLAGGGTGGHLFPAIAIARELSRLDPSGQIEFVGTRYGIEYGMKDQIGYPLALIAMRGLARRLSLTLFAFPFRFVVSIMQALRICSRFRPDVVVGTGGYVSGPVIIAASIKGIPRAMQEQNSYPGLVTRKLAARADVVFIAYKKAQEYLPAGTRCEFYGNPVRSDIASGTRAEALKKFNLRDDRKTILILGGSQGARRINQAVLDSLDCLDENIQLLWQSGKRDYTEVASRLDKKDFAVALFPFCNEMELVYAAADLAVARAGALTLAELTACGVPSLLIPFPQAAADHQTHNAAEVVAAGAAEMIPDTELDNIKLLQKSVEIVRSDRLSHMANAARKLGRPHAAAEIAQEILNLAASKGAHRDRTDAGPDR